MEHSKDNYVIARAGQTTSYTYDKQGNTLSQIRDDMVTNYTYNVRGERTMHVLVMIFESATDISDLIYDIGQTADIKETDLDGMFSDWCF